MRMKCTVALLLAFSFFFSTSFLTQANEKYNRVIMISIDGLRPEFYLSDEFNAPNLKQLYQNGASATGMESVFPTVTYPNHTSLITGVAPARHGVLSNSLFDWQTGPSAAWYWEAPLIKSPTLWQQLAKVNKKTASVRWPVTVDAKMAWNVPEIFPKSPWYEGSTWELTVKLTKTKLMQELLTQAKLEPFSDGATTDKWAADAAAYLSKTYKPDLTLVHLIEADHTQHSKGRNAQETKDTVEWVDNILSPIIASADANTCIFIVGDHGFFNYKKSININRLFVDKDWIRFSDKDNKVVESWDVIAQKSGGQAAIYSRKPSLKKEIMELLEEYKAVGFNIIKKPELDRLEAYPEAIAAIEAVEGFTIGGSLTRDLVTESRKTKGQHGYHPAHPKMHTGFIASGCGIKKQNLGKIHITDVAPTILKLLGTNYSNMTGKALNLK